MAIILNIDTSGNKGMLALAKDGSILQTAWNDEPMQHASFVQPAVGQLLQTTGISMSEIDAIAVSNGPGSYTGLRVGLASAKGLCYALDKPLIAISSLQVLAYSVCQEMTEGNAMTTKMTGNGDSLDYKKSLPVMYCAMIDARRMEVFFALYSEDMHEVLRPRAALVNEHFLQDYMESYRVVAMGSGANKWKEILVSSNVVFAQEPMQDKALCELSFKKYVMSKFDSLVDIEPFYAKEFYNANPIHHK